MEFRKFLSFLMVLLCCSLLVIGCSDDDDDSGDNDQTEEVVDEGEQTPGNDDAVFDDFSGIVTSGGRVAFIADSFDGELDDFTGIYSDISASSSTAAAGTRASLRQVASNRTDDDAPEGSPTNVGGNVGLIGDFRGLAIEGNNIYFSGSARDDEDEGIFVDNRGEIDVIVDTGTSAPGGNTFTNFGGVNVHRDSDNDNDIVAFVAAVETISPARESIGGIFITSDGGSSFSTIADEATLAPNNGGNGNEVFREFGNSISVDEDGTVAFIAEFEDPNPAAKDGEDCFGVFTGTAGENITLIADEDTTIPGTTDNEFEFFFSVSISDGNVAFIGLDDDDDSEVLLEENKTRGVDEFVTGIYTNLSGELDVAVDNNTAMPSDAGNNFCVFLNAVIDGDRIVFSAFDEEFISSSLVVNKNASKGKRFQLKENLGRDLDGTSGIYVFHSGDTVEKVIDNSDFIPGSSDQTFRAAFFLDFEDDEINASIVTSASDSLSLDEADTILTIEDTPSIVSFRTQANKASTTLNWQTVCGEVLGFHVWRSTGEEYERITSSAIAPERSNSRKAFKFSYTDDRPAEGQSFYKLEIMKLDGTSEMIRPAYND